MPVTLRSFQKEDVQRMWDLGNRVLNANEVGLGKTIEWLTVFMQASTARPGIVVCPSGLKTMWKRAAWEFYGIKAEVLEGRKPRVYWSKPPDLLVVNYDILEKWLPYLKSIEPQFLCFDEGQYLVNLRSRRTQACIRLSKKVPHIHVLSGTPIVNRHWDLFPILHILDPARWDSPFSYGMEFCSDGDDAMNGNFSGSTNHKRLHRILKESYLIRRTKAEVLKDLPKLSRCIVPFDIDNRAEYVHAERDFLGWLASYDMAAADRAARAARFVKMGYLKRLAVDCKMQRVFDWIDSFLANSDGKLILGAWHRKTWPHTMQRIEERYKELVVSIHGGIKDKDAVVQRFQNDPSVRIIDLQLKAGGVGINLQGAKRTMGVIEMPWHSADVAQFIGRGHRIGTLDPVMVNFLIGADTIEDRLLEIIQRKAKIVDKTIDGGKGISSMPLLDELQLAMQAKARKK